MIDHFQIEWQIEKEEKTIEKGICYQVSINHFCGDENLDVGNHADIDGDEKKNDDGGGVTLVSDCYHTFTNLDCDREYKCTVRAMLVANDDNINQLRSQCGINNKNKIISKQFASATFKTLKINDVKIRDLRKAVEHGYDKILRDRSKQGRQHTVEGYAELFQLEHAANQLFKDPSGKNVDFQDDMRKYSGAINFHQFVTLNCNDIFDIIVCAAYLLENENGARTRDDFIPECKYYVVRLETRSRHFEMSNRRSAESNEKQVFCRRIVNANTKFSISNVVRYCDFRNIVQQVQLLCGKNSNEHALILALVKNLHSKRNQKFR